MTRFQEWLRLLAWLGTHGMQVDEEHLLVECRTSLGAGKGLFAVRSCPASTPLLTIPAACLMNVRTLGPHYSQQAALQLTAVQLISLHLFLHRPHGSRPSDDPLFGPYISVLPVQFDSHPLTWLVKQTSSSQEHSHRVLESSLLQTLPESCKRQLDDLAERFHNDWKVVQTSCGTLSDCKRFAKSAETSILDYLWAWLIGMNTRCIYYRLKEARSDADNLTLCPVLDFANHTPYAYSAISLVPLGANIRDNHPTGRSQEDMKFLAPGHDETKKDEELYLTYGAHCNRTLFVEYGFVNENSFLYTNGEVDVQDLLETIIAEKGAAGNLITDILKTEGYWGDWTLHVSPQPAHPSFRLITALRLCCLEPSVLVAPATPNSLELWRETLLGSRYAISEENEHAWRSILLSLCQVLLDRADTMKTSMRALVDRNKCEWSISAWGNITYLWDEESYVASDVIKSLGSGVEF